MQGSELDIIFSVVILVFSAVAHEVAHGYMADRLGDRTARMAGRLTLNPVPHIDPVGSILVPLVLALLPGGLMFGWAKPVPYNPYNLRDQRWGEAKVAAAGPLTNLALAVIFGLLIRFAGASLAHSTVSLMASIVIINLILAIFNSVPIPPLDGSKVLASLLPPRLGYIMGYMARYALVFLVIFVFFLWEFISPLVWLLFGLLTGMG